MRLSMRHANHFWDAHPAVYAVTIFLAYVTMNLIEGLVFAKLIGWIE